MPRQRKIGYTTIGIPISTRDRLKDYGEFGESWDDLFLRLLGEVEDYRKMKERYFKRS